MLKSTSSYMDHFPHRHHHSNTVFYSNYHQERRQIYHVECITIDADAVNVLDDQLQVLTQSRCELIKLKLVGTVGLDEVLRKLAHNKNLSKIIQLEIDITKLSDYTTGALFQVLKALPNKQYVERDGIFHCEDPDGISTMPAHEFTLAHKLKNKALGSPMTKMLLDYYQLRKDSLRERSKLFRSLFIFILFALFTILPILSLLAPTAVTMLLVAISVDVVPIVLAAILGCIALGFAAHAISKYAAYAKLQDKMKVCENFINGTMSNSFSKMSENMTHGLNETDVTTQEQMQQESGQPTVRYQSNQHAFQFRPRPDYADNATLINPPTFNPY